MSPKKRKNTEKLQNWPENDHFCTFSSYVEKFDNLASPPNQKCGHFKIEAPSIFCLTTYKNTHKIEKIYFKLKVNK